MTRQRTGYVVPPDTWWLDDRRHDARDYGDPPARRPDDVTWRRGPTREERRARWHAEREARRAAALEAPRQRRAEELERIEAARRAKLEAEK